MAKVAFVIPSGEIISKVPSCRNSYLGVGSGVGDAVFLQLNRKQIPISPKIIRIRLGINTFLIWQATFYGFVDNREYLNDINILRS